MKVAPIIHVRTYSCDFNSEFRVKPEKFLDSDIKWARKIVLEGTSSIDSMHGERWVIADNGKYRLAGIVGFLKNICLKCNLTDEQKKSGEDLFYDNKGRLVYAFIGVVMEASEKENNAGLTYDYLWDIFVRFIQPVWKNTYQESITTGFEDYQFSGIVEKPVLASSQVGTKTMYETNPIMDYQLFCNYLGRSNRNNFSFCSNMTDINDVRECEFTIVTTSNNIITRLQKEEMPETKAQAADSPVEVKNTSIQKPAAGQDSKKKFLILLVSCLMIFVIIILMFL